MNERREGAGSQRGGTCGPLAVFGITSQLNADHQYTVWLSRFPGSKGVNTLLEKKEFLFGGKREKKS